MPYAITKKFDFIGTTLLLIREKIIDITLI